MSGTVWFVASRGRDRHQDYTWVPSGPDPGAAALRQSMERATLEHLSGGGEPNVFLRRAEDRWVLALWQLRHPSWPADAESRPIMAHVIAVGEPGGDGELPSLSRGALVSHPPGDLLSFVAESPGFRVSFAALERWGRDCAADPDLASAAQLVAKHRGWQGTADAEGFVLAVPAREGASHPKGHPGPGPSRTAWTIAFLLGCVALCAGLLMSLIG